MRLTTSVLAFIVCVTTHATAAEPIVSDLWPDKAPGDTKQLPPEADLTKPTDKLIAGRRIIKLGNVSTPQIAVYRPPTANAGGTAVVICPGGGHHILAYDLEGTEIAQWLSTLGVTGIVLKYRVPFRDPDRRWIAAVQDAQRAMSLVRSKADDWGISKNMIGICGFSAGGEAAALTSVFLDDRQYEPIDQIDDVSSRPDFTMLIYPGGLVAKGQSILHDYIKVSPDVPPMFLVHAFDDPVSADNSLALATALKSAGVPTELHVYASGGHGYGMRKTDEPVTHWPDRAEAWMHSAKIISPPIDKPGGTK